MTRVDHDEGASAVEYGLLVFAIAAVIALIVFAFGLVVSDTYDGACEGLKSETKSTKNCGS